MIFKLILNEIGLMQYAIDRKQASETIKGADRKKEMAKITKRAQIILTSA